MARFEGLSLVWVEAFVEVAGSTKRKVAADKMGITQGTVTKHVQKLERWLGRVLVFDGVRPRLTPDGQRFLPVARQILELFDDARAPLNPAETPPAPPAPRISAKHIKVPALRQPQKEG